ncbi:hypothetical protein Q4R26_19485, partial [Morganella morganii]
MYFNSVKNRKQKNQSAKSSGLWQTERSQHSHRPEDETDKSAKSFVSQEGGKEKSPGSIHQ